MAGATFRKNINIRRVTRYKDYEQKDKDNQLAKKTKVLRIKGML